MISHFPGRDYATLGVLFALCAAFGYLFRAGFDRRARRFARWIRGRGLFPITDPVQGQRWTDAMRILIALTALWRCVANVQPALNTGNPDVITAQLLSTGLTFLILIGLATPLSVLLLLLLQNLWLTAVIYRNGNLPSAVLIVALIPLLLCPAGRTLSVDAWLLRRGGFAARLLRPLYGFWGEFDADRFTLGLFGTLAGYSMVCLSACVNHLLDPGWRSGYINAYLLLSPQINARFHGLVDRFYEWWPQAFVLFACVSTYGMLFWEGLLLPMCLWRPTRWLAVAWGLLFFAVSFFVLRLVYLASTETALWVMLFAQFPRRQAGQAGETPAPAEVPAPNVEAPPLGIVLRVWALSFVVISALAAVREPVWLQVSNARLHALRTRALPWIGNTTMVYGFWPVIVFDTRSDPMTYFRHLSVEEGAMLSESESDRYRARAWFHRYRRGSGLLELGEKPDHWRGLIRSLSFDPEGGPVRMAVRLQFGPTDEDLRQGRYVPLQSVVAAWCDVDPMTREITRIDLEQEGVDAVMRQYGLSGRVDAGRGWVLRQYPMKEELEWLAAWHARKERKDRKRLAPLWEQLAIQCPGESDPADVIPLAEEMVAQLRIDWDGSQCPPPEGVDAHPDLQLARAYHLRIEDDKLRQHTARRIEEAEAAYQRGDHRSCLLHCAAVRRAFFDSVYLDR